MRKSAKESDGSYVVIFSKKEIKDFIKKKVKVPKGFEITYIEADIYVGIAPKRWF